jgi:hypothetical protein
MSIHGGDASAAASTPTMTGRPQITTVENNSFFISVALMVVVVTMLVAVLAVAAAQSPSKEAEREVIKIKKEELLAELAKLDDLNKMGAVSDRVYKLHRTELMNTLAQIYYRLKFGQQATPSETPSPKEDPARV